MGLVEAVPRIPRTSWRARCYLKWWDVPVKIRAAKRAGVFDQVVDQVARGPLRTAPGNSLASIDWTLRSAKSANASAASAIQ